MRNGGIECDTISEPAPRGICGSGLVDAVAAGLQLGAILPNGRLAGGSREFALAPPGSISQSDVRELQLAKGAIAAGLHILADHRDIVVQDLDAVYLAGAFGNYVRIESARRIGLMELEPSRIVPAGNTSLRGLKMALLCPSKRERWIAPDTLPHGALAPCVRFSFSRYVHGLPAAGPVVESPRRVTHS